MLSLPCCGPSACINCYSDYLHLPAQSSSSRTSGRYELLPKLIPHFKLRKTSLRSSTLCSASIASPQPLRNEEFTLSADGESSSELEDIQPDIFPLEDVSSLNDEMLSALQNRNTDEAWRIYELLITKKHIPTSVCLSRLVAQLSYIGTPSSLTKAQRLVAYLQKRKNAALLDSNCLGLLAMATSKAGAARYSASIIRLMLKLGLSPHVKAWSAVVSRLGKDREDVPLALSLFEEICSLASKNAECQADASQYGDGGLPWPVMNSVSAMQPDTMAFNAALNGCANACLVDKAYEIFNALSTFKLQPDVLTFNIMIKLYAMSDNRVKLSSILTEMGNAGVTPCLSTMHSLVSAYVGLDELERALALVKALKEGREDISRILTSDMKSLDASQDSSIPSPETEDAAEDSSIPFSETKDLGLVKSPPPVALKQAEDLTPSKDRPFIPKFKPDTRMYTIVMKGYMQKGRISEVRQLLLAMKNQDDADTRPNEVTYTTVISTCVRLGLLDDARGFLLEMVAQNVPANVVTYNVLAKGYCEALQVSKGRLLLEDMKKAGVQPDVVSYNTLIDGYIDVDDSVSALAMFTQMREAGIAPSKESYTNLIKAFGNNGQPSLAAKVFDEMQQDRRVKVDTIAWNSLIESYSKAGHVEGAKAAFQRMKDYGHVPTVATYGSLVKGFASRGKAGEALVLWKEIKERLESNEERAIPLKPDAGLLDGLVDICVREGFFLKALEVLACMEKHQIPADKIKYKRMFVELHSKLYTSPHTSQARIDRTAERRRAVEAFKFWVGLPNTYYGRDWSF